MIRQRIVNVIRAADQDTESTLRVRQEALLPVGKILTDMGIENTVRPGELPVFGVLIHDMTHDGEDIHIGRVSQIAALPDIGKGKSFRLKEELVPDIVSRMVAVEVIVRGGNGKGRSVAL